MEKKRILEVLACIMIFTIKKTTTLVVWEDSKLQSLYEKFWLK